MTTRISKDEMALLMPHALGHYFQDDPYDVPAPEAPTLLGRLTGAWRWLAGLPGRRAVLAELSALSDHELADIGLTRGELPMVFQAEFAARRGEERSINRLQTGRAALI